MKFNKRISIMALVIMLAAPVAPAINSVMPQITAQANSQTNKLPRRMRYMWYGRMNRVGFKRMKLYSNPYIYNGSKYLHITHIRKERGHHYEIHVPNADPIDIWYSHGHLNGFESGTNYIHLYR